MLAATVRATLRRPRIVELDWRIAPEIEKRMRAHAKAAMPREACGLLGVKRGRVIDYVPYANSADGNDHFQMAFPEPEWPAPFGVLGLFHSHPTGSAKPSATDVLETLSSEFWRDRVQVIYAVSTDTFGIFRIG